MAEEQAAVVKDLGVGARVGGASMVVTLVSLSHAISHAYGALLPLIVPFFMSDLHLTYTQIGGIFSLTNLLWGPLQLGFGALAPYAPRKRILGIGHLCQGAAMIGTGFAHGVTDLLGWRVVARLADAPQHPIGNTLIAQSFRAQRLGMALALNTAGANLGTVAVPLLGGFLIATVGWRSTLSLFGFIGIGMGALLLGFLEENRSSGQETPQVRNQLAGVWAMLRQRDVALLFISQVVSAGGRGLGVVAVYVPLYLTKEMHVNEVHLGILLTLLMGGSVVGPLLAGVLSDRAGRKSILIGNYVLSAACFIALLAIGGHFWLLPVVLLLTGMVIYSDGSLTQTALADIADRTSMDMVFGLYFAISSAVGAPWALLVGLLVDGYGFPVAFGVMAASRVLAGLCLLPLRRSRALQPAPLH